VKHPPGKIFRWAVVGFVAVSAVLAAVYFFRGPLLAPYVKRLLESSIESNLGIRPAIGGIDGSYVTNLEVTGITLMKPAKGGKLVGLRIQRLRADYRLWSLMKGIEAFIADMTIMLEGARLEFDLSSRPESPATTDSPDQTQSIFLPEVLPRIHIREVTVSVRGSGYETTFEGIELETRETASTGELRLRVGEWRWIHPYLKDGKTSLSAVIKYENGALAVGPVMLGGGTLAEYVRFELGKWPSAIPFDAKFMLAGGHATIKGTFDNKTVNAQLEADRIHLAPIADLFRPPEPELAGTLSMKSEVVLPLERTRDMEADLDLQLDRARIYGLNADRLEAAGSARGGTITLERMYLRTGSNIAEAKGVAAPVEMVFAGDLRGLLQSVSGMVALDCRDVPMLFSAAGVDLSRKADSVPSHRVLLAGRMHNGIIDLSMGSMDLGDGGHVRLLPSQVALPAGNRPLADAAIQAGLDIDIADLGRISRMLSLPPWSGALRADVTLTGTLRAPGGTATVTGTNLSFRDVAVGDMKLQASADMRAAVIESLAFQRGEDRFSGRGTYAFEKRRIEGARFEFDVSDLAPYTKNLLPKGRSVRGAVHGTLLASGPLTDPDAQFDMTFKGIQWGGINLYSARVKGFSSNRRITVDMAEAKAPRGQVSLSGRLLRGADDTTFDLELETLALYGQARLLALDKPAHIRLVPGGKFWLNDVSLSGPAGSIQMDGVINRVGKSDLRVSVSGGTGEGWFDSLVTDRLKFSGMNASARLTGPMDDPHVAIEGELAKLVGRNDLGPLAGRFDLILEKKGITIQRFEWRGDKGQEIAATGIIPINVAGPPLLRVGPLSIDATVNLSELSGINSLYPEYIPPEGSLHGELHLRGTWEAPTGEILLQGRHLKKPPYVKPMPSGPFDMDGRIRFNEGSAVVETVRVSSPDLTFSAEGSWTGIPALLDIFRDGVQKVPGHVALAGRLRVPNLGWLAEEIPGIQRISGELEADASVKGPLSNPAVTGAIRLTDGELRPDMDVPSIQAIHLEAAATPERLQLLTLTGELGGSPFQVTGSLQRHSESGINLDLQVRGENLLFYRSEGVKVRADTDLTVKGTLSRLSLAGEMAITDGHFLKYFDVLGALKGSEKPKTAAGFHLFSIREPPFSNTGFDVRIASKQPFRVRNNLINGAIRPDLKLRGTGEIPVLAGIVYVDPTRLALPAGSLVFDSGVIRFDKSRPDRPALELIGKSRMAGYDITVAVEGPYDEPVVTLSSVPPLSNEDLLLLVLTGRLPESTGGLTPSQRQKMNVAVYLGRDLIARWFSRQRPETEVSVLDRFQIDIGRAVTRAGDDTVDAQFRLVEGFLRDGDTLYISGEKDVFDFYNAGVKIVFRFK
jgi:hypothetical protein